MVVSDTCACGGCGLWVEDQNIPPFPTMNKPSVLVLTMVNRSAMVASVKDVHIPSLTMSTLSLVLAASAAPMHATIAAAATPIIVKLSRALQSDELARTIRCAPLASTDLTRPTARFTLTLTLNRRSLGR